MRFERLYFVFGIMFLCAPLFLHAADIDTIKQQIDERNQKIKDLEAEIAQYEKDLTTTTKQKQTLQGTIKELDLTRKKLVANISLTQQKIAAKDTEIDQLSGSISTTGGKIDRQMAGVAETIRALAELDREPLSLAIFSHDSFSTVFDDIAATVNTRSSLEEQIDSLRSLKSNLEDTKAASLKKRQELAALKQDLSGQQKVLDANRAEQAALLKETQNKESNYQKILAEKQALHDSFEQDLLDLQNQLQLTIDPSSIPKYGTGVLSWPVDPPVAITQYFGNTAFATQNPQVYNGKGHNGIDLRASVGTKIKAALSGVVKGTGDTDLTCPGASYGRWVLVEHANGLSTLYAHLSAIQVSQGQQVTTGQIVGYSGNTGYTTGPHLHFTVYATQGVQIQQFPSKALACKGRIYVMPVADIKAYLNPLSYL